MPKKKLTESIQQCSAREALAFNMVRLRAEHRWSQEDLAYEAQVHRTFVTQVERQQRNITLDNLEKLAKALGVTPSALLAE
ncbi:helix-turn-helix domain-containing protein [Hydrogenophaga flava]|uniref:helix-turn-helix domain-containing protein n=1 Tax=Hydrogenophaga flava TaxID=65657 RepID=UPI000826A6E9|nr:helix-turn-helix transcriptional regulator [Hydrogenophaga flava]